ncbi:uncharacterized protein LOC117178385 [Belonocnema kinseyi]|uniref:uncharacterized protein LOC117178385 n=1 Tax=Belonocnema kinseyi TaxID=2817044 RepID=UPI00143DFAB6|nr:uncharacterized protein LOC117178385 [Belonocnema kinseyi]
MKAAERPSQSSWMKKTRVRSHAFIIEPAIRKKYADVLKTTRNTVNPDQMAVTVKGIRETRNGEVLVEMGASVEARNMFSEALTAAVWQDGQVRQLVLQDSLDVRDLDDATDEQEVRKALEKLPGLVNVGEFKINLSKPSRWSTRVAFIDCYEINAKKLDVLGHIRIGWVSCKISRRFVVTRCYRCHGFGHIAVSCKEKDRSKSCLKCGKKGHMSPSCKEEPHCYLCEERLGSNSRSDHIPGSFRCLVYKEHCGINQ